MDNTIIKKQCGKCKKRKPITEFHDSKCGMYGVNGQCKVCKNRIARENYSKRQEGTKQRSSRQKGKDTEYGKVCRSISASKLWSHRKRLQVLTAAGIDLDFDGTDEENIAHAERIDYFLNEANLKDIRNDSKSALQ